MGISGYLQLGTSASRGRVATPPSGTNYTAQPIAFDATSRGTQSSSYQCVFGPVSGSWGRLNYFAVTEDLAGLVPVIPPGILEVAIQPADGALVIIPPGYIEIEWPGDKEDMFGAPRNLPTVTVIAGGNSQLMATPCPLANVLVNSGAGSAGPYGISLPQASTFDGNAVRVYNRTNAVLYIYPYSGDSIESLGVNAGYPLIAGASVAFSVANNGLILAGV